ncbi:hypothetical protein MMC12_004029 [Toensbergia leucococca]|nr:hypothetical protein [Toensbergia leucococca]
MFPERPPSHFLTDVEESRAITADDVLVTERGTVGSTLPPIPIEIRSSKYAILSLRLYILTAYRRLFSIVLLGNLIAFTIITVSYRTPTAIVNAATANLTISALARQPCMINAIIICCCSIPRAAPMWIRKKAGKCINYGGVHSGCGVASVMWYTLFVGLTTHTFAASKSDKTVSVQVLVFSYLILGLLLAIVVAAYPKFRTLQHNAFEYIHRFSSYTAIVLFWALLLVMSNDLHRSQQQASLGRYLLAFPSFWFALIITINIVWSWVHLRIVAVRPEYLSDHAIRLHFCRENAGIGMGIKIAKNPLKDWHSFASIPDQDGNGFSCIISNAGDWTKACIRNPPTRIWKRGLPVCGLVQVIDLFRSVVIVATGSGIGPCLSILNSETRPPIRALWQTRSPEKTYGLGIVNAVKQLDQKAVIIDTDKVGRKDMLPAAWGVFREAEAEAVFCVSNPAVTKEIVFQFEARGIAAYGPVFDS